MDLHGVLGLGIDGIFGWRADDYFNATKDYPLSDPKNTVILRRLLSQARGMAIGFHDTKSH